MLLGIGRTQLAWLTDLHSNVVLANSDYLTGQCQVDNIGKTTLKNMAVENMREELSKTVPCRRTTYK